VGDIHSDVCARERVVETVGEWERGREGERERVCNLNIYIYMYIYVI